MLRLIQNEVADAEALDNVVALHPSTEHNVAELNVVELDNIVEMAPHSGTANAEACVDGVCSINWKPQRPSAA